MGDLRRKHLDRSGNYGGLRGALRALGPCLLVASILFISIGFYLGLSRRDGLPSILFFACGAVMVSAGVPITWFAYIGVVQRYLANETAPVEKDVVNYMAEGTQEAVRTTSRAAGAGLSEGFGNKPLVNVEVAESPKPVAICPSCKEKNDLEARFCDACGSPMNGQQSDNRKTCEHCQHINDHDARYCDNCGLPFV